MLCIRVCCSTEQDVRFCPTNSYVKRPVQLDLVALDRLGRWQYEVFIWRMR
jgi:hypothetical protein